MIALLLAALQDPIIEPVKPNTRVEGASLWLFAVDDGTARVAVSAENTRSLLIGRLDLDDSRPRPSWQEAAGARDTEGLSIADHWHVFAHDHHWLSFSTGPAQVSYLVKLDKDFRRIGLWKVADHEKASDTAHRGGLPTNDHFLIAEPEGVAVGHFLPGHGHRVFRFDKSGRLQGKIDVGGGKFRHSNGSSVLATESGYQILATEFLNFVQQGGVLFLDTDRDWNPKSARLALDEERKNIAMASGVRLPTGHLILNAKVCSNAYPRGQRPPPPPKEQKGLAPDDGSIVRYVLSPEGKVLGKTLLAERGCRPHTLLRGDLLITTWDGAGLTVRVDRIR